MPGNDNPRRRLDWVQYFLRIADDVSLRADCTRRQVGAVLVDSETKHIISTGYNGSPPGKPGCLTNGACTRGLHYQVKVQQHQWYPVYSDTGCCACGAPWPCAMAVSPSSSYDTGPGACTSIHAEANALLRAGIQARASWLFLTHKPCDGCWKLIHGAGVRLVVWHGGFWPPEARAREEPGNAVRKLLQRCRRAGPRG